MASSRPDPKGADAVSIVCANCGFQNDLSRVFCLSCGHKLDLDSIRAGDFQKVAKKGSIKGLFRAIRILITLAFLAVVGLALWPSTPTGRIGRDSAALFDQANRKVDALQEAREAGRAAEATLTEIELNTYMVGLLRAAGQAGGQVRTQAIRFDLQEGRMVVHVEAGLGPLPITYELTGQPLADGRAFRFASDRVRMGHLPVPAPADRQVEAQVGRIFSQLQAQRALLDRASEIEVQEGRLTLRLPGS